MAFRNAYGAVATMSGVPLVGTTEATCQKLEELTGIVGTLAEATLNAIPGINTANNNCNSIVFRFVFVNVLWLLI